MTAALQRAIETIPAGAWAVGVSGGADSVALLALLQGRGDVRCHAVHLDHETRGGASAADARFVAELCAAWKVPCTLARRSEIESRMTDLPANRSARFRDLRLELFRRACAEHGLAGVILAHHADDQAETILQRLVRGSAGPAGLVGMQARARVVGLTILRPLLGVRSAELRQMLRARGQAWCEDSSNASPAYQRNRVRAILAANPPLSHALLEMSEAMAAWVNWARSSAPALAEKFAVRELADQPEALAIEAARRWLGERGAPREALSVTVLARLIEMARDAATPPRRHFPGRLLVTRRSGRIGLAERR